ncbi:MAG: hypothetical protein ACYTEU_07625 [Planctomycetota bacterium]
MMNEEQKELTQEESRRLWKSRASKITILVIMCFLIIAMVHAVNFNYKKIRCRLNIYPLHLNFLVYSNDHDDKLPPFEVWNDMLMEYTDTPESVFHCPASKSKGRTSDYSLNANLPFDAGSATPEYAVFLFESIPGWNQSGTSEIFNFSNHNNGGWYNTLSFPEGYFIKPIDVDNLKWKP